MSIFCIGELLIDFLPKNISNEEYLLKKAGGAPANVCATISKLGTESFFCGKIGSDSFGNFLESELNKFNVNTYFLKRDFSINTTLAFVTLDNNGEREFSFVRGADKNLHISEVELDKINSSILHFGSATGFLEGDLKDTYYKLFNYAKEKKLFISFDPNYRQAFWGDNKIEFIEHSHYFIKNSDFVKLSDEELEIITGEKDLNKGSSILHKLGAKIIAVTLGKDGTYISLNGDSAIIPSIKIQVIDTTGAGDAFVGAFLHFLHNNIKSYDFNDIKAIVEKSNKIAAKVCTELGALEAIEKL